MINLRFAKLCPKKHLRVYGVPEDNHHKYKASKHRRSSQGYIFDTEPPQNLRLYEEEIKQDGNTTALPGITFETAKKAEPALVNTGVASIFSDRNSNPNMEPKHAGGAPLISDDDLN